MAQSRAHAFHWSFKKIDTANPPQMERGLGQGSARVIGASMGRFHAIRAIRGSAKRGQRLYSSLAPPRGEKHGLPPGGATGRRRIVIVGPCIGVISGIVIGLVALLAAWLVPRP